MGKMYKFNTSSRKYHTWELRYQRNRQLTWFWKWKNWTGCQFQPRLLSIEGPMRMSLLVQGCYQEALVWQLLNLFVHRPLGASPPEAESLESCHRNFLLSSIWPDRMNITTTYYQNLPKHLTVWSLFIASFLFY